MLNRERGSYGQMISTLCFAGVGLFLLSEVAVREGEPLKVAFMGFCAVLSLAGAVRFQIARVASWLGRE
ncbi:hypothetical protein [Thalassovita mediterranea]|jgi:hypothetical protein|uniref:Uncharacterized protein n=1 Tax=Thalassovita mediterranea TaxID=340021 RepID=A0A0P1GSF0_9RHOB|nr:hypothetical protein [Thalassovita mediterranea]MCG7572206.1 hypothetical protein [Phaeobacter sp. CNT1-3]CUH85533.1 hypothetical protein TM5383_02767 [Thalassovita mediterranea]SIS30226.1 hypothetical protein SAMN05421685_102283 [Thalassovita mediterranea]